MIVGAPVYDRSTRFYGYVSRVMRSDTVELHDGTVSWQARVKDLVKLNGERPDPDRGVIAERLLRSLIDAVLSYHATSRDPDTKRLKQQADRALGELSRAIQGPLGTRSNPDLAVMALGANPPRGEVFGQDVLGIVYQHEDDRQGERRVHLFGKGGRWQETRGGRGVELYNLPAKTGVFMEALGDKKVVLAHRRDLPLVGEF